MDSPDLAHFSQGVLLFWSPDVHCETTISLWYHNAIYVQ